MREKGGIRWEKWEGGEKRGEMRGREYREGREKREVRWGGDGNQSRRMRGGEKISWADPKMHSPF